VLAYFAISLCSSVWCPAVVWLVVEQAGSKARLSKQAAISIFMIRNVLGRASGDVLIITIICWRRASTFLLLGEPAQNRF
jgi:hypothetical protein